MHIEHVSSFMIVCHPSDVHGDPRNSASPPAGKMTLLRAGLHPVILRVGSETKVFKQAQGLASSRAAPHIRFAVSPRKLSSRSLSGPRIPRQTARLYQIKVLEVSRFPLCLLVIFIVEYVLCIAAGHQFCAAMIWIHACSAIDVLRFCFTQQFRCWTWSQIPNSHIFSEKKFLIHQLKNSS